VRTTDELISELCWRAQDCNVVALVVAFDTCHEEIFSNESDALQRINEFLRVDGARVMGFVAIKYAAGRLDMTVTPPWSYSADERHYCQVYLEGVAEQFRQTLAANTQWRD
jgi:hypothetical protein